MGLAFKKTRPFVLLGLGLVSACLTFTLDFPWKGTFITGPARVINLPVAGLTLPIRYVYFLSSLAFLLLLYKSRRFIFFFPDSQKYEKIMPGTALLFLVISLIPGPLGEIFVIYLLLSSTATVLILFGLYGASPARPFLQRLGDLFGRLHEQLLAMKSRHFILSVVAISLAINLGAGYYLFDFKPHVIDCVDQFFHAKIITTGHVKAVSHPLPAFFDLTNMINDGHWYSQYPPGHLVLIALGILLGAPGLVNPLLGALTLLAMYGLGRTIYDEKTARLAALLGLASPFILFMSSEYMSHASALLFFTLFLFFFIRTVERPGLANAVGVGICLGMLFLIRPYTAVAVTLPACLYFVLLFIRRPGRYWKQASVLSITALLFLALFLLFNYSTTGDPVITGYAKLWNKYTLPGFNEENHHTFGKGVKQTLSNLNAYQKYLFEWPLPGLLFAILLFGFGRLKRWEVLFYCSAASLSLFYLFYYYQDYCFGPRFYYEATTMAVLLTSRGIILTSERLFAALRAPFTFLKNQLLLVIAGMSLIAFSIHVPDLVRIYRNNYFGVKTGYYDLVKEANLHDALVFVHRDFLTFFIYNSPALNGPVVYAADRGIENDRLMAFYPERHYYLFDDGRISAIRPHPAGCRIVEAESLRVRSSTMMIDIVPARQAHDYWSGSRYVFCNANRIADSVVFDFNVARSGDYKLAALWAKANYFGITSLTVDDRALTAAVDGFVANKKTESSAETALGNLYLAQGEHTLTIRVDGKNPASSGFAFGLDCILLMPQ